MSPPLPKPVSRRHRRSGVALVIILAFVVILTGVILAFFSRAISSRQVSNASASQTKVDLLAEGAADQIVGDLQQEIEMSSIPSATNVSAVSGLPSYDSTFYLPSTPASMLPQLSGTTSTVAGRPPNLLIRSAYDYNAHAPVAFYTGSSGVITGATINVSSTMPSLNGRSVSTTRWNAHYLLPLLSSGSDATPTTTGSQAFTPPDWILVTRNGSPATSWNSNLVTSNTNGTTVIGRYSYAIYHEGGLLDANVAGYPSTSGSTQYPYKPALAYADLSQVFMAAGVAAASASNYANQLVAWRNSASAQQTGPFNNPSFSPTSGSNYYSFVISNPTGFLTVSSTGLNNGQSDRMFGSRQELIAFMQKGLGLAGANLNVLNYLATFTRDLSQPSLVKAQNINSSLPAYDSSAPKIQAIASGGNNETGLEPYVNPAFLAARVSSATPFTRNDGSLSVMGEPLVKHRFALNRLTWLTYEGPSANRTSSDPDMQLLVNNYGIPYGFLQQGTASNIQKYFGLTWVPDSNSKLGKWVYNVHNGPSGSGTAGPIMTLNGTANGSGAWSGGITELSTPHEPDFFELLKACIGAGSKAKAALLSSTSTAATSPENYESQNDISIDYAIMQIGANIIAQSKVDGFGVRIDFNASTSAQSLPTKEFSGVENNPYFYRVRWGALKIRQEAASPSGSGQVINSSVSSTAPGKGVITDPGVSMLMLVPEIWNPHDQNAPMPGIDRTSSLAPTNFRIVADSSDPDSVFSGNSALYNQVGAVGVDSRGPANGPYSGWRADTQSEAVGSYGQPYFAQTSAGSETGAGPITGGIQGYLHVLTSTNTAMTFSIPNRTTFREPTLLARYNIPSGTNLKIDATAWQSTRANPLPAPFTDFLKVCTSAGTPSFSGNGFRADVTNPLNLPNANLVTSDATEYVGIPIGLFPCEWVRARVGSSDPLTSRYIGRSDNVTLLAGSVNAFTFRLQYLDPTTTSGTNWVTYDTKYTDPTLIIWTHNILGTPGSGGLMQWTPSWSTFVDPRSSRFGSCSVNAGSLNSAGMGGLVAPGAAAIPSFATYAYASSESGPANPGDWLDQTNDVLVSNRPTADAGRYLVATTGTFSYQAPGWYSQQMFTGMFSQNSMTLQGNGIRFSPPFGTDTLTASTGPQYYSDADAVVRRGMGAFNTSSAGTSTLAGLPVASTLDPGPTTVANQSQSRPWILHRPFRSVAELGYVFSGTPWKNLDFFSPESGDGGLLDVFCINDTTEPNALVAGRVNLNTAQEPVLKAILASAYCDEQNPTTVPLDPTPGGAADQIANALIQRTSSTSGTEGELTNISELVGKWVSGSSNNGPIDGSISYTGFSNDLSTLFQSIYGANTSMTNIERFREAALRPLAAVGTTRTWNLMIDLVAQTGRYPQGTTNPANFVVDGEQRYWVHVAIDRLTGQVLDKQVEIVKE